MAVVGLLGGLSLGIYSEILFQSAFLAIIGMGGGCAVALGATGRSKHVLRRPTRIEVASSEPKKEPSEERAQPNKTLAGRQGRRGAGAHI